MFNWRTIAFGLLFGFLDSLALPLIKNVSLGWSFKWMAVPAILYAASPFIFLSALKKESLTIMNLVWDLTSDVIVTLIGLFIFSEKLPPVKMFGVVLSLLSLLMMTYEGDGWNEFISRNYNKVAETFGGFLRN